MQDIMRSLTNMPITHLRPDSSVGPGLAESWRYLGPGNKNFEFTLRHDARFSDGTLVTAKAVKAWLDYFSQAKGPNLSALGPIRSVETEGKWTVRLHLATPNPIIPYVLSEHNNWGFVSGPTALANPSTLGTQTDGAGPYVLDPASSITGDHYTLIPNKYFYDKSLAKWSKVVVRIISSPSTMLAAVETGQVDVAVGDRTTASAAASGGITVEHSPGGTIVILFMDRHGKLAPPLGDVRVRRVNYAIDRRAITTALMGQFGSPTSQFQTTDGADPKYDNYYPYNPTKAKQLLAAAGHAKQVSFNIVDPAYVGNFGDPVDRQLRSIAKPSESTSILPLRQLPESSIKRRLAVLRQPWNTHRTQRQCGSEYAKFGGAEIRTQPVFRRRPDSHEVFPFSAQRASSTSATKNWVQMSRRWVSQAWMVPVFKYDTIYYVSKHVGGVTKGWMPFASEWYPK